MAEIVYPKNLNVTGLMSFPLYSETNLDQLQDWRQSRSIAKPRFPDTIGATLLLNQQQHDRVVKNLLTVYLPFAATLKKVSDGKKGIDPKLVAKLTKLVEEEDWSESNLPIRDLTEKDQENLDKNEVEGIVSKLRVAGPANNGTILRKALVREDPDDNTSAFEVTTIDAVADRLGEATDPDALWWGAGWPFKTSVRFNAYNAANFGVSAYIRSVYLLADRELKQFGNAADAEVLEDGDDWED